jgi:hypothetical protein
MNRKISIKSAIFAATGAACAMGIYSVVSMSFNLIAVASIASTAYVLFVTPLSGSARVSTYMPAHIIGYGIGTGSYFLCCIWGLPFSMGSIIAVGIIVFVMAAITGDHPPAAGTALLASVNGLIVTEMIGFFIGILLLLLISSLIKLSLGTRDK